MCIWLFFKGKSLWQLPEKSLKKTFFHLTRHNLHLWGGETDSRLRVCLFWKPPSSAVQLWHWRIRGHQGRGNTYLLSFLGDYGWPYTLSTLNLPEKCLNYTVWGLKKSQLFFLLRKYWKRTLTPPVQSKATFRVCFRYMALFRSHILSGLRICFGKRSVVLLLKRFLGTTPHEQRAAGPE